MTLKYVILLMVHMSTNIHYYSQSNAHAYNINLCAFSRYYCAIVKCVAWFLFQPHAWRVIGDRRIHECSRVPNYVWCTMTLTSKNIYFAAWGRYPSNSCASCFNCVSQHVFIEKVSFTAFIFSGHRRLDSTGMTAFLFKLSIPSYAKVVYFAFANSAL